MRRSVFILLGVSLSLLFFVLALRSVDVAALTHELYSSNKKYILLAVLSLFLHLLLKALRWQLLLRRSNEYRLRMLLPAVVIGSMGNMFVPHSGEVLRSLSVARQAGTAMSTLLASIAAERVFDLVAILVLLALAAMMLEDVPILLLESGLYIAGICVAATIAIWLLVTRTDATIRLFSKMTRWMPRQWQDKLIGVAEDAVRGLSSASHRSIMVFALLLSLLQWAMMGACIFASIAAVGALVSLPAAAFVLFLTVAGLMLPTAPGYIGTLQLCFTVGLAPFGIGATTAFAASVVYNATIVVIVVLAGVVSIFFTGLRTIDLEEVTKENQE